ncbi:hypothetical protein CDD82_7394 [Ophiocordyceps australis]|uniref:Uncharacterized protein n=1 Tax=Ophiocordyceps australis TaxID=1399860 RepID=A0A2C5XVT8_9HYPO|nr:hypothetical protein CDD82_7394 [Ophiocordyceps australis]
MLVRLTHLDALLGLVVAAAAAPYETFNLYAYGTGIGGFPVFAQGNMAYLGDEAYLKRLNASDAALVKFTAAPHSSVWNASSNQTAVAAPFSNSTLFVPRQGSPSSHVGFSNDTAAQGSVSSDGFTFYGDVAMHVNATGHWETHWCAEATDSKDVWALHWDPQATASPGNRILLELKATGPATNATGPVPPTVSPSKPA